MLSANALLLATAMCATWSPKLFTTNERENEMDELKKYSTRQLVEELSLREGVERINVDPHTQTAGVEVTENGKSMYAKYDTGPVIILWIID